MKLRLNLNVAAFAVLLGLLVLAGPVAEPARAADAAAPQKVYRYAFRIAETGFDPAQIGDVYSRTITPHIFEGMYQYDPLARPVKVRPLTAAGMPEFSADFRTWTVKIQPGIYFAKDEAFKGKPRELVAEDYVYAIKRFADPAVKSQAWTWMETFELLGLRELRNAAIDGKKAFEYDKPIEGVRTLDRYTVQFRMKTPSPRFITSMLASSDLIGAVAREVVEFYGDAIMAHPVGTGPFKLVQWRRSSFIALERNPDFREMLYTADPAPDDTEGQALLARLKGKRLPMIDRVEVSIIEENQPRWLTFLQGASDMIEDVPFEFIDRAMPGRKVAPNLAKQGIRGYSMVRADAALTFFNMEDPVVGGYTPDKVALRRAIGLATDVGREINLLRRGQAVQAQTVVAPGSWGYDPALKTENSEYSVPRAKALLDLFGYADKDGDGWRDLPDGTPLVLSYSTQPDELSRQFDEVWKKNMDAVGLRLRFERGQWPEQLKMARAGQLMIWQLAYTADSPDSQAGLALLYGPASGGQNLPRFKHARFDEVFRAMQVLPDGPERLALLREAQRIVVAYMPHKYNVHRIVTDLTQPWLVGYRRPAFNNQFWQFVDVDTARRPVRP